MNQVAQLLALDLASNCELIVEGDAATVDLKPETELFQLPTPTGTSANSTPGTTKPVNAGERVLLQPPICCYTFGQPRVGNRAFSRLYKQRVPHTFRVATEGDPFTAMPHMMCCAGIYKHAGKIESIYLIFRFFKTSVLNLSGLFKQAWKLSLTRAKPGTVSLDQQSLKPYFVFTKYAKIYLFVFTFYTTCAGHFFSIFLYCLKMLPSSKRISFS